MIVVNKADAMNLPKEGFSQTDEKRILNEAIPRNLYSGGMYFVSSIMGLGAKKEGELIDDHYAEIFEMQRTKYTDPNSRFYKMLYKYNIMPEQMKKRAVGDSEKCGNRIWANSGLYWLENDIQIFAKKHSSYNKCQQSQLFLGKVIKITSEQIQEMQREREESKRRRGEALERDKKELIEKLEEKSDNLEYQFIEEYPTYMEQFDEEIHLIYTVEDLEKQEEEITKAQQELKNYDDRGAEVKEAVEDLKDNIVDNIKNIFKEPNVSGLKSMGKMFTEDIKDVLENMEALNATKKEVDKATAEELVQRIMKEFEMHTYDAQRKLERESINYWGKRIQRIKNELVQIITGSTALTDDRREELSDIIMTYHNIEFDGHAEDFFIKDKFFKGIWIGNITLIKLDEINISKLERKYNSATNEVMEKLHIEIQKSHNESFKGWLDSLVREVTDNIVEYSPVLRSQALIIKEETEKILEFKSRQKRLELYTEEIKRMMDWKEN